MSINTNGFIAEYVKAVQMDSLNNSLILNGVYQKVLKYSMLMMSLV